jgi:alkylhydroperoxidase family enzyme
MKFSESGNGANIRPMSDGPRIAPIPPRQWPSEMREALAALVPPEPRHPLPVRRDDRPKGLNVLGTLAHYPALTRAFHTFNGHVLFATSLSTRQRELLVLRVAALRNAQYEWAQHVVQGMDAGLSEEEIARVAEAPDAPEWSALERVVLAAVDELISEATIADATWEALAAELDEQQLMDLVFTVGAYEVLAMALKSFGVQLDADLE